MEIPTRAVRHFPVVKHKNEGKSSQTLKSFWGIILLILGSLWQHDWEHRQQKNSPVIADQETCMKRSANGAYPGASFHTFLQVSFISLDGMILSYTRLQWGKMVLRLCINKEKRTKHKKSPMKVYLFVV